MKYTYENTAKIGKCMRVFLDGVELDACVECDTDKGYAIIHAKGDDGEYRLNQDGDEIMTQRLEGTITVEPI